MATKKNLIIICPDEMRADCAGFMGNRIIKTPNMDAIAARGVVFEKHFAVMPKCVPSRVSLMTGRYTHTGGYRTVQQHMNPDEHDLLAILRDADYQTALFGKDHCWGPDRLEKEFDFTSGAGPLADRLSGVAKLSDDTPAPGSPTPPDLEAGWDYVGARTRHQADEKYTEQAIAFLEEHRDSERPFFLQLNIESPHPVYGVEEPWFSMYKTEELNRWPIDMPDGAPLPVRAQREVRTAEGDLDAASAEVQRVYYGMISKVDMLVGKVIDALARQGLLGNSVILFWSDHGDYAGQYGLAEKWDTHFPDCLTHVPCVLVAPGLEPARVDSFSETTDLGPTLCELLDLPSLSRAHGESLLPAIRGERRKEMVFSEGGHERAMRERYPNEHPLGSDKRSQDGKRKAKGETYTRYPESMARARMVRTDRWKLVIRETDDHELYDLQNDRWELSNIWAKEQASDGTPLAPVKLELTLAMNRFALRTDPDTPHLSRFSA